MPRRSAFHVEFRLWREDPIIGPSVAECSHVLNVLAFVDRASDQLIEKLNSRKTLQDHEAILVDQNNFLILLRRALDRLPVAVRDGLVRIHHLVELEADVVIQQSWLDWYSHKREKFSVLLETVEDGLPAHPDFSDVWEISGEIHQQQVSINIEIKELGYRVRQAFEFFCMLWRIFCSPVSAPPPGEELPFGPENINPDLPCSPRTDAGNLWFPSRLTIRQACKRVTLIFLVSTIRDKQYPKYLPALPPLEGELPPDHFLSQTVD